MIRCKSVHVIIRLRQIILPDLENDLLDAAVDLLLIGDGLRAHNLKNNLATFRGCILFFRESNHQEGKIDGIQSPLYSLKNTRFVYQVTAKDCFPEDPGQRINILLVHCTLDKI